MKMFRRLTSVHPLCTRKRTTGQGWIWPAEGCNLQPEKEDSRGRGQLTSAYVCPGSGFSRKIMPWTYMLLDWRGIKSFTGYFGLCMTKCFLRALSEIFWHYSDNPRAEYGIVHICTLESKSFVTMKTFTVHFTGK